MAEHQTFLWSSQKLLPSQPVVADEVLAADSWRVEDGQVVALERHRVRFQDSVVAHRTLIDTSHDFVEAVVDALPRSGSWFPRIDLISHDGQVSFRYQHRPRPAVSSQAVVQTARLDPRQHPTTKGPDLAALGALRDEVTVNGADEAIIVRNGYVCEGAYSTVLAWSMDGRSLYSMGPLEPRIASVTESVIIELAQDDGYRHESRRFVPDELDGLVVWVVSALHGIREISSWLGGPRMSSDPAKHEDYQARWLGRARGLPETQAGLD